jgi:hypothetical protein
MYLDLNVQEKLFFYKKFEKKSLKKRTLIFYIYIY